MLEKILPDMVPPGAPVDEIMKQQLDAIMEAADLNSDGGQLSLALFTLCGLFDLCLYFVSVFIGLSFSSLLSICCAAEFAL